MMWWLGHLMMVAVVFSCGFLAAAWWVSGGIERAHAILDESKAMRTEALRTYEDIKAESEAALKRLEREQKAARDQFAADAKADKTVLLETLKITERAEALLMALDAPVSDRRH